MAARPESGRSGKRGRLSRSADFQKVYRKGRSRANRFLVFYVFSQGEAGDLATNARAPRLGLSVSRKVGGAVARARVKRVLREAFWAEAAHLPEDCDYVIVARPPSSVLASEVGTSGMREQLRELITGLELVSDAKDCR